MSGDARASPAAAATVNGASCPRFRPTARVTACANTNRPRYTNETIASASPRQYRAHSAAPRRAAAITRTTVNHTAIAAVSAYDLASNADHSVRGSTVNATAAAHAVGRSATSLPNTTRPAAAMPTATALGSRAVNRVEVQQQPQDVELGAVGGSDRGGLVEPERRPPGERHARERCRRTRDPRLGAIRHAEPPAPGVPHGLGPCWIHPRYRGLVGVEDGVTSGSCTSGLRL